MACNAIGGFPSQQLSFSKKGKAWRNAWILETIIVYFIII